MESRRTSAFVRVDHVGAGPVVLARMGQAFVKVVGAVISREPRAAVALVGPDRVPADPVVAQVFVLGTLVHVVLALGPRPTIGAFAFVTILKIK